MDDNIIFIFDNIVENITANLRILQWSGLRILLRGGGGIFLDQKCTNQVHNNRAFFYDGRTIAARTFYYLNNYCTRIQ